MRLFLVGLVVLSVLATGCTLEPIDDSESNFKDYSIPDFVLNSSDKNKSSVNTTITVAESYTTNTTVNDNDYVIGSFNIQVFGQKKATSNVMPVIENIIDDYDILAIQEVRDLSGTVIEELNFIQGYDLRASPRLGRSSSKEQYIFFYSDRVVPGDSDIYPDLDDDFEREPFAMEFTLDQQTMIFIQVHIKPDDAEVEIKKLPEVVEWAKDELGNDKNIYIMGDLNADCTYFDSFEFLESWNVLIGEEADTTTSRTNCAYDRILSTELDSKVLEVGIDNLSDETGDDLELIQAVSDHYPIYMVFDKI